MYVMVAVKDTGIGISKEGQKRLFERFRQATPKTGEDYGGSGLGLNISRKLCHIHGGEIGVASNEGSGSTFGFFFKVKRTQPRTDELDQREKEHVEADDVEAKIALQGLTLPDQLERSLVPDSYMSPPTTRATEAKSEAGSEAAHLNEKSYQTATVPESVQKMEADRQLDDITSPKLQEDNPKSALATFIVAPGKRRRLHVLLAEDNIVNQRLVFRKLEKQGFNVTAANNGREAVDGIRNAPQPSTGEEGAFDIVLMDQEM